MSILFARYFWDLREGGRHEAGAGRTCAVDAVARTVMVLRRSGSVCEVSGRVFDLRSELVVRNHETGETETRSVVAGSIVRHTGRMALYFWIFLHLRYWTREAREAGEETLAEQDGDILSVWTGTGLTGC